MKTPRSHGRQSVQATLKPRELMVDKPELSGAWMAKIITLFPSAFPGVLGASLTGKALDEGLWQLQTVDLRSFGIGKHRNVDDTPAGGGRSIELRSFDRGLAVETEACENGGREGPIDGAAARQGRGGEENVDGHRE